MGDTSGLLTLSASRLKTFSACPKQYYYAYIDKQDTKKHPAAVLGTAVHRTIERVYRDRTEPVSTFIREFDAEAEKCGVEDPRSKYKNDGIKMVGDFDYGKRIPKESELEFTLAFPNQAHPLCMVHGYIDQAYDWGFVDLKTNARKPLQGVLDNDLQFIVYNWAYKEIYGQTAQQRIWQHLRTGEDLKADVEGKEDLAARVIERILEADFTGIYDKNIGAPCILCNYRAICLGTED